MRHRLLRQALGVILIGVSLWPAIVVPGVSAQDQMCFPETGECIADPVRGYWLQNGGLPVFGFPVTSLQNETNRDTGQVYPTQWFERNRFELHADTPAPYDIQLGRLGDDRLLQLGRNWQVEGREAGPQEGCLWFEQTGHNVCNQGGALGFRRYWETHGLQDPRLDGYQRSLALFGLPLTAPRMETNESGHTVLTQWFERARFEWHPNNADEFKVLLGLLGNELRANRTQSSAPEYLTGLGGVVYFTARTSGAGNELWRSDGTAAGTNLVKDIWPGPESGTPFHLTPLNGAIIFTATDERTGHELWRTDGTAAGTYLLRDIFPGADTSFPTQYLRIGTTVFFIAIDGRHGAELWKTDGTPDGTKLVKDIRPGPDSSEPALTGRNECCWRYFTNVNGILYFTADDGDHGTEIWRSDGTEAGTRRVTDAPAEYVALTNLAAVDRTLYFTWIRTNGPPQLWRSDGTTGGSRLVKDWGESLRPQTRPENMTGVGGTLFFTVDIYGRGRELWKSDGTPEGTVLVKDINPGEGGSGPFALTALGNQVVFGADDAEGPGLWRSDGTEAGTIRLARVRPVANNELLPARFVEVAGRLVFFGLSSSERREIWITDGTPSGTRIAAALPGQGSEYPRWPVVVGNRLFFTHNDVQHGNELWQSDLTAEGTGLVADINTDR